MRPLRTKQAKDVAEMIANIYKVGSLTYPKIFQCDNGSEFKADVTKMLEKHEVKIRRVMTKYKHTHTAFVKALNKILAEKLFKVQDAQELNDPEKVSETWVKNLYGLVDELNDTTTEMIGMKSKDAIKLDEVLALETKNFDYSSAEYREIAIILDIANFRLLRPVRSDVPAEKPKHFMKTKFLIKLSMPLTFQHSYDQHQSLTKFQFTLEIKSHQLCHMNTLALLPANYLTFHQPFQI